MLYIHGRFSTSLQNVYRRKIEWNTMLVFFWWPIVNLGNSSCWITMHGASDYTMDFTTHNSLANTKTQPLKYQKNVLPLVLISFFLVAALKKACALTCSKNGTSHFWACWDWRSPRDGEEMKPLLGLTTGQSEAPTSGCRLSFPMLRTSQYLGKSQESTSQKHPKNPGWAKGGIPWELRGPFAPELFLLRLSCGGWERPRLRHGTGRMTPKLGHQIEIHYNHLNYLKLYPAVCLYIYVYT